MDRSSFGSALDGSDLGGNEVQAVRMSSWLAPQRARGHPSPRKPLEQLERQSHGARTNPSSCPAWQATVFGRQKPGASSSSASARFDSSFANFRFVASCVGPFAEAGARYRVASSTLNGRPERVGHKGRRSAARDPARECWAFRWSEQCWQAEMLPSRITPAGRSPDEDCSSRGAKEGCRAPLHTHPWHDERTRPSHEGRFELETGA
jgi:hypothetical protein